MSIEKTYSIYCDGCFSEIGWSDSTSKSVAIANAKKDGVLFRDGKHFCDEKCYEIYKQKLKEASK